MSLVLASQLKVSDLPLKFKIITIHETANFAEAMHILIKHKILSAPVVVQDDTSTKAIGQIDLLDLMVYVVHISKRAQEIFVGMGLIAEHQTVDFSDLHVDKPLQDLFDAFDESSSIANFSKLNPVTSISPDSSIGDLFRVLTKLHRVVVLDSKETLINYITQSDLIKFLYRNKKDLIGELAGKTVGELGLGTKEVVSINENKQVIEAFKIVAIKGISAIAVVDNNDQLVGDIGAHDLRTINPSGDMIDKILILCKDFMRLRSKLPHFAVTSTSTLASVIEQLETKGLHRVWVVNKDNKVTGVISLGDVLDVLSTSK